MGPVVGLVQDHVLRISSDLFDAYKNKEKHINELRVRIVAFRDLANDLNSLEVSKFFLLETVSQDVMSEKNERNRSASVVFIL